MTPVEICNIGLIAIGQRHLIQSFEDGSVAAECAKATFRACLNEVLSDAPWNDAAASASLPAIDGSSYTYLVPQDLLVLRDVASRWHPWRREGKTIVTKTAPPLCIAYTRSLWDGRMPGADIPVSALLASAVGHRFAAGSALRITGNPSAQQAAWQLFQAALVKAHALNAMENSEPRQEVGSWIDPESPDAWDSRHHYGLWE